MKDKRDQYTYLNVHEASCTPDIQRQCQLFDLCIQFRIPVRHGKRATFCNAVDHAWASPLTVTPAR